MGMSAGSMTTRGGTRGRRRARRQPMAEINVTPLVDVMLVLLIIFMVAAPLMTVGVPIDLPEAQAKALNAQTQPITVSIDKAGDVFIQDTKIPEDAIVAKLKAIATTGYKERIFVRGDTNADYGTVVKVMTLIANAGFTNLGLVTTQEKDKS